MKEEELAGPKALELGPGGSTHLVSTTLSGESSLKKSDSSTLFIYIDFEYEDQSGEDKDNRHSNTSNDMNMLNFKKLSYSVVDSTIYDVLESKEYDIKEVKEFIDKLTDSINDFAFSQKKPFCFVVLKGWDLRLKFIKYCKDNELQLPNYLEYPNYFDLYKEYIKFEEVNGNAEFNSIEYKKLDLDTIKKKFSIESTELSNIDAMIQITRKMHELSKFKFIFQKPHDLNLDLSYFFNEKSKIIYITNLPNDTTQSELDSVFNQQNDRSITFWLIKNPNYNGGNSMNLTLSGFIIFNSHEEAIKALTLNGSSFNNKLIEVQPSSIEVFNKAQDILISFPTSKNKPRPGDWNCPSCGFSNFQRRTACFRCSFPIASVTTIQESIYGNNNYNGGLSKPNNNQLYNGNLGNIGNSGNSSGNIGNSGYINNSIGNNGNSSNSSITNNNNNSNNNNSNNNTNNNNINTNGGNNNGNLNNRQNSNVPFRAGDWKCLNEACSYHNFAKNVCCLKCGSQRVQSAIINGHVHNNHKNRNHLVDYNTRSNSLPQLSQQNYNGNNNGSSSYKYIKPISSSSQLSNGSSNPVHAGFEFDLQSKFNHLNISTPNTSGMNTPPISTSSTPTSTINNYMNAFGGINNVTGPIPSGLNDFGFDVTRTLSTPTPGMNMSGLGGIDNINGAMLNGMSGIGMNTGLSNMNMRNMNNLNGISNVNNMNIGSMNNNSSSLNNMNLNSLTLNNNVNHLRSINNTNNLNDVGNVNLRNLNNMNLNEVNLSMDMGMDMGMGMGIGMGMGMGMGMGGMNVFGSSGLNNEI
ncbi:hypothetical protein JL09_g3657 [Pichia kudriavzevii]|uniref:Asparagine-rich protein n=1 Tax=Pichia kudriavzevii TaxID=4909 RepID=A0A099NWI5_PICKU|nr:hypothetical protein JL09_g3657 [Pichia kudriavzevii]